jgi:CBS domain-containing protein
MKVNQVMTPEVETISPDATTKEAAHKMLDRHIGALPVLDGDQLVGIITDRDICCRVIATGRDAEMTKVHQVMQKEVATCFEDQEIFDAATKMMNHHIRRLAVLNRDNHMAGFLSIDDIAHISHDLASTVLEAASPNRH